MFNSTVIHWIPSTDRQKSFALTATRIPGSNGLNSFKLVFKLAAFFLVLGNNVVDSQDSSTRYLNRPSVFQELNKLRAKSESYQKTAVPNLQELIESELAEAKKDIVANTREVDAIEESHAELRQTAQPNKGSGEAESVGEPDSAAAKELELKAIHEKLTASDRTDKRPGEIVEAASASPSSSDNLSPTSGSPTDLSVAEVASYLPGSQGSLSRNQAASFHRAEASDPFERKQPKGPVVDWSEKTPDTGKVVPAAFDLQVLQLPQEKGLSVPTASDSSPNQPEKLPESIQQDDQEVGGNSSAASREQTGTLDQSAIAAADRNIDQTVQKVGYSTLVILLFGVAVMFVLYKLGIRGSKKSGSLKSFKVLEKTNINSSCQLQLVEIESHQVLVGVDKTGIKSVVCLPRNFGAELTDAELENENELAALADMEKPATETWSPAARSALGIDPESVSALLHPHTSPLAMETQPRFGEPGSVEKRTA